MLQARSELQTIQDTRSSFRYHQIASQWTESGDRVTKMFCQLAGPKHATVQLKFWKKRDGEVTFDSIEMRAIATEFYERLLTTEDYDMSIKSRERVWTLMPTI